MSRIGPEDPMRARATDCGPADGWRGARIGALRRELERREAHRIPAAIDIGEPAAPRVTIGLLLLVAFVTAWEFTAYGTSPPVPELARAGGAGIGAVATGAWWKFLTANLLHANVLHLAMNAFVIFLTGRWLEHLAGRAIVLATIGWSALASSLGALLVGSAVVTIGASGIAFGLVGCTVAIDPRARTAAGVIARQLAIVNVVGTFVVPGISIGGHLGGLAAGLLVGLATWRRRAVGDQHPAGRRRRGVAPALALAAAMPACVLLVGPGILPDEARELRGRVVAPLLARQLEAVPLSDGSEHDDVHCVAGSSPVRYRCSLDGVSAEARFRSSDDQWSIAVPRG